MSPHVGSPSNSAAGLQLYGPISVFPSFLHSPSPSVIGHSRGRKGRNSAIAAMRGGLRVCSYCVLLHARSCAPARPGTARWGRALTIRRSVQTTVRVLVSSAHRADTLAGRVLRASAPGGRGHSNALQVHPGESSSGRTGHAAWRISICWVGRLPVGRNCRRPQYPGLKPWATYDTSPGPRTIRALGHVRYEPWATYDTSPGPCTIRALGHVRYEPWAPYDTSPGPRTDGVSG